MAGPITIEKVRLYERFGGNEDAWSHSSGPTLSNEDWYLIERLVADIVPVEAGLTSADYANAFRQRLTEACDAPSTEEALLSVGRRLTLRK